MDRYRIASLLRLYITLLLIFATQRVVFMLFNMGLAGGAPFGQCLLTLWHGLRLDSVMACYLLVVPAVVMLVGCFVRRLNPRRVLLPYYWLAALLLAATFAVDTVLYNFWGAKFDANDLIYATKPKDVLASLDWWMAVLGLAAIAALTWHYWRRLRHATPTALVPMRKPWAALLALPLGALMLVGIRGGTSTAPANPSFAYYSTHAFCNHAALNPTFNFMHSLFKAQDLAADFALRTDDEVDALLGDAFTPDTATTARLLRVRRPDIMLVIWESGGSGMVMNDSVGPELMRLADEGVYFSRCYADNYRTDRGLVSIMAGWLGLPTTSLMKRPDLCRHLPSLARTLHSNGYTTRFLYGGDIDFTNMRLYFIEAGFDTVGGSEWFPSHLATTAWGVPDEHLLRPELLTMHRHPYLSAAITLSSHEPWDVPMDRLSDPKQNAFAYTDSCLGAMMRQLRQSPQWDSLLVIILPDHGVTLPGAPTSDPRVAHIPVVWTGGAIAGHAVVDTLMSQSDLAATLLAQMGIGAGEFTYSRNILAPTYGGSRQFALHAYKGGCNLITPGGISNYDCTDRRLTSTTDTTTRPEATQAFIEALLQSVYSRSAALAR